MRPSSCQRRLMHPFTNSIFPILGEQASLRSLTCFLARPHESSVCTLTRMPFLVHLRGNFIVGQALDFCNKHDQYHMSGALEVYGC